MSNLNAGTTYTYSAYSDSGCTELLATETFTTAVSVDNLDAPDLAGSHNYAGLNSNRGTMETLKASNEFTTGASADGYTLSSVTVHIAEIIGTPGDIVVAIYSSNGGAPGISQVTLSGDNPTGVGQYTYTCPTTGNCALSASAKYHVVMTAPNTTGSNSAYYIWEGVLSGSESTEPAANGWSLGRAWGYKEALRGTLVLPTIPLNSK